MTWSDGSTSILPAVRLRGGCRCSECAALARGRALSEAEGVTITSIREIGVYGVNIEFSDGHRRGIFPWTYLYELAAA